MTYRNIKVVLEGKGFGWPRNRFLRFFYPHVLCFGAIGFTLAIICLGSGIYLRIQTPEAFFTCAIFYLWGILQSARKITKEFRRGELSFQDLHVFWSMILGFSCLFWLFLIFQ